MTDSAIDYLNPADNPAMANAAIANVLREEPEEIPSIETPRDGLVRLPAGLARDDGSVVRDVEVQELNGAHEERLAKTRSTGDPGRYLRTLLNCGVVEIGGQQATEDMLDDLLVGDREYLVLAIRTATYGPEIEVGSMICEGCEEPFDMVVSSDDITLRPFTGERQFEVPLRRGGHATVRLPNGADQEAYLTEVNATDSERNSVLLARCVLAVTDATGDVQSVAGFPSLVRDGLGIVDRQSILKAINNRQPGPRYDEVEYVHECGAKITASVGLMHLFPGL